MCYTWASSGGNYHNYHDFNIPFTCSFTDPIIGTFEWALTQLKSGQKLRRKSWDDSSAHIYLRNGEGKENDQIRTVGQNGVGEDSHWQAHEHHLLATDWEIYVKRCGSCGQQTP